MVGAFYNCYYFKKIKKQKLIYGFDTFSGFPKTNIKDRLINFKNKNFFEKNITKNLNMYYRELRNEWGHRELPKKFPKKIIKESPLFSSWSECPTLLRAWYNELLEFDAEWRRNK